MIAERGSRKGAKTGGDLILKSSTSSPPSSAILCGYGFNNRRARGGLRRGTQRRL